MRVRGLSRAEAMKVGEVEGVLATERCMLSLGLVDPKLTEDEVGMWQAYYKKERLRLFGLLMLTLREQYRYTWARSAEAGFHLARAAATFGDARGGYERVLPDLERAYTIARDWSSAGFDPAEVGRAELDWWVARRDPARDSVESVGALIAREYALIYGVPQERVAEAGRLRADAGALRDKGGAKADWAEVARRLRASYRSLHDALAGEL